MHDFLVLTGYAWRIALFWGFLSFSLSGLYCLFASCFDHGEGADGAFIFGLILVILGVECWEWM